MNNWKTLAAVTLAATLFPEASYALVCGQIFAVPTVVKLNANLGPCAADGLIVQSSNVTINLNGYRIFAGPGNVSNGIYLQLGSTVEIGGPGEITGFKTGIRKSGIPESDHWVHKVTLTGNGTGMLFDKLVNGLIVNNVVTGGLTGIFVSEGNTMTLSGNRAAGVAGAGLKISNSLGMIVTSNTFNSNVDGMVATTGPAGLSLRAANNTFSNNATDGARVSVTIGGGPVVLYSNTANSNGRDGLGLTGNLATANSTARANQTGKNGRYGINVTNDRWRMYFNKSSLNTTLDMFWDAAGANTCFMGNTAGTWAPFFLPGC